ncbi:hypothetical protein EBU95_02240 [bacterium]|nr:hypothetical protein [bacterium]
MQYPYPYFPPPPPPPSGGIGITVFLLSICFLISAGLAYFLYRIIENKKPEDEKPPNTNPATSATTSKVATTSGVTTSGVTTSGVTTSAIAAETPPQNTFNIKQIKLGIENKCLDGNGDKLLLSECDVGNTNTRQQWTFDGNLKHNWSEKCIDDSLKFVVCSNSSPEQKWKYDNTKWTSSSGKCLTGYFNDTTNQNVYSDICNDSNYKKWIV